MSNGYVHPLYLLPFDHRHSYITGMFHVEEPLSPDDHDRVAASKAIIFDGFKKAIDDGVPVASAGILVDEEFGSAILREAKEKGFITAISTEKSGSDEFEFEYGESFGIHLEAFHPTFAKVLVRYNPDDEPEMNRRQAARLAQLSNYCSVRGLHFMFELLVPPSAAQLKGLSGDKARFDSELRPDLMYRAVRELQDAGIEPDIWKIEGLDTGEQCKAFVAVARRDGRDEVGCIVLGRGADEGKVVDWLKTAAAVDGFIGFAVGRTTFWDALMKFEGGKSSREEAVATIAERYTKWVNIFLEASAARPLGAVARPRPMAEVSEEKAR